jgi:hypothetical protein
MKITLTEVLGFVLVIMLAIVMAQDANARGVKGFKIHSYSVHIGHTKHSKLL